MTNTLDKFSIDLQTASDHPNTPSLNDFYVWVGAALNAVDKSDVEICIRLVDSEEIHKLNKQFRKKDKPTDVLSFPYRYEQHDNEQALLGDIVICAPCLEAKAKTQNVPLKDHWAHIVIHSVLHLLGYDHLEDKQAADMEALEIQILQGLHIANPYEPSH